MRPRSLVAFAAGCLVAQRRRKQASPSGALIAVPDRRRRPTDGVVAEASIVAHVLRLRLLTLDATVVVSPAEITAPAPQRPVAPPSSGFGRVAPPTRSEPLGRRLALAARDLEEGAAILTDARRTDRRPVD